MTQYFVNCLYLYIVFVAIFQSFFPQNEIAFISYLRVLYSIGYEVNICVYTNKQHLQMNKINSAFKILDYYLKTVITWAQC